MKKETKEGLAVVGTMLGVVGGIYAITKVEAAPPEKPAVQLKLEWHSDPEFFTDSIHSASVTVTNPTDWFWTYGLELFVAGTSLGILEIALDAHTSSTLTWADVVMPSIEGEYLVYILPICITTGESLARVDFEPVIIIPLFDPWVYDFNDNGYIDIEEQLAAISDYIEGLMTISQQLEVINLYVGHVHRPGSVSAPDITIAPAEWTS